MVCLEININSLRRVMLSLLSEFHCITHFCNLFFLLHSNAEDYVHRIGRTGRQNKSGTSYTLFTEENHKCARELIEVSNH